MKPIGRLFRALLMVCLLWPVSSSVTAQTPPLQVLLADVWPWSYRDESRELQGLLVDLFRALEQETGLTMELRLYPHQRVMLELSRGNGDLSILFANPAVDRFADRSAAVVRSRFFLLAHPSFTGELNLKNLPGKPVGYMRGNYYGKDFETDHSIIKIPITSLEQGVMMLHAGRLTAMISSEQLIYYTLKEMAIPEVEWRTELHSEKQMAYLYRRHDGVPATRIQPLVDAIEKLRASGELNHLVGVRPLDQLPGAHFPTEGQSSLAPTDPAPE